MVLCDTLVQAGAHPGMSNKHGLSIFNSPVATKQLLFRSVLAELRKTCHRRCDKDQRSKTAVCTDLEMAL